MVRKLEGYSLLVLEVFIIFLNILAIIVIFRFKKKYNPDILIFTLAVADLLKASIPLNMTLVAYLSEKGMAEGTPSCIVFGWTAFTLNSGIMLVMTLMAIDRYVAMCWPFQYKHLLSKKRLIYTIIAVFAFSGTQSALPLVGVGKMRSYNNGSFCHFDFDSTIPVNLGYNIFVLVLGISMLVVVIFCYTRAMFSVRGLIKRQRRMSAVTRDIDGTEQKRQAMNRMFARLMIVMMMVFCLSWLLFLIVVLQHVSGWFKIAPEAHFWSMRLAVVNSLVNPLIGAAMCKPYRTGYLFLLCKFLHCCGLCSSYKAENPWTHSRRLSVSSRSGSDRRQPRSPTTNNETLPRITSNPSFSYHDSGIVPDSSIGYHQGGLINAAYEMDPSQAGQIISITEEGRTRERPRLQRKRISFKDEVEAKQAGLVFEGQETVGNVSCTPNDTTGSQQHSTVSLSDISSRLETSQLQGSSCLQEGDKGNSMVITSKVVASSAGVETSEGNLKYVDTGVYNQPTWKPHDLSSNRPKTIDLPQDAEGSGSFREDNTTEEKTALEVKTSLENAFIDNGRLQRGNDDAASVTLQTDTGEGNELKLSEEAKVKTEISEECQSAPSKDHNHELIKDEALLHTLEITHFPVGTNSDIKTTKVNAALFPKFHRSKSSHSFPHFSLARERTGVTSPPRIKPRSRSFANVSQVTGRNITANSPDHETCELYCSIKPATPSLGFDTGPLVKTGRRKSNFNITKSFESALRKKPHGKSDSTTYGALDLPPFQRHTSAGTGEQLVGATAIQGYSETDLTRSLPETVLANVRRYKEKETSSIIPACDPQITRSSSKIYKELSELSEKELEREVFC